MIGIGPGGGGRFGGSNWYLPFRDKHLHGVSCQMTSVMILRKLFKRRSILELETRRAYCAISLINYSADLILISWMFSKEPVFLDVLFCISSALIGISITGLYLKRPSVMLPDVLYKVVVSACALFNAILDADNGTTGAGPRLLMVFFALLSHIYENYFLFNAIAAFYREQEGVENSRPPPSYNLFAKSAPKPASSTSSSPSSRPKSSESSSEPNEDSDDSPPPTYEFAMEKIREKERQIAEIV